MKKIAVIYASKYGATDKAVHLLKEVLEKQGHQVALCHKKNNKMTVDLAGYDFIIIGGSIYAGQIQKTVKQWVLAHLDELMKKEFALFLVCGNKKDYRTQLEASFPQELIQQALGHYYLGYEYKLNKMNFVFKMMIKKIAGISQSESALDKEAIYNLASQVD